MLTVIDTQAMSVSEPGTRRPPATGVTVTSPCGSSLRTRSTSTEPGPRTPTVAAPVGDGGLERGDHRKRREDPADLVEPLLLGVGVAGLPGVVEARDGRRVHVGGGADAAGAAVAHALQQEGLGAGEDVEAALGERVQEGLRVLPVAAAVLHAGD